MFIICLTLFKYERSSKQNLLNQIHNTRADRLRDVCRKFILTVHNFHQFEKVEWNKLVRAEIEATKYFLGQQKKSQSNKWETEFASPEVKLLLLTGVNIKTTHFQFAIYLTQNE